MIAFSILALAVTVVQPAIPVRVVDSASARVWEDGSASAKLHGDARTNAPRPRRIPSARPWSCQAETFASVVCTTTMSLAGRPVRVVYNADVGDVTVRLTMGSPR